jgi:hypothetical protein
MMSREQRVHYEILDRVFKADGVNGYATDTRAFTESLLPLFSDISHEEFTAACRQLIVGKRLDIQYHGLGDEQNVFAGIFFLSRAPLSRAYFDELRRLIDVPSFRKLKGP